MAVLISLSSGGIIALLAAAIRLLIAINANTTAIRTLTEQFTGLRTDVNHHDTRIAVLEDRGPRRRTR